MIKHKLYLVSLISSLCFTPSASALVIQLNDIGGAAPGTLAGNAFIAAANIWSSLLADPITLNFNVGFSALGSGILGSTTASYSTASYTAIRDALIQDQSSQADNIATSNLQLTNDLKFLSSNAQGVQSVDNNGSNNNLFLDVTTANLKALNLLSNDGSSDGTIQFSSLFNFDFDPSDGILAGAFDFIGVAVHEIGHALGFVSGVDALDAYSGIGPGAIQNLNFNQYAIASVLDLFRFSTQSTAINGGIPDLAIGDRAQYLSIDKGQTQIARLSSGAYNGDGRQASHWKDNLGIGLLDPTLAPGELGILTPKDLLAFDIIGYNLVSNLIKDDPAPPAISSPSSLACFLFGAYGIILHRRKTKAEHVTFEIQNIT
jgi:hypothetical protein